MKEHYFIRRGGDKAQDEGARILLEGLVRIERNAAPAHLDIRATVKRRGKRLP